ncbi:MAG: glycosyltransferase family 4 protein, partial [Pseudomonadota bacterium]|nr:glycosyltransferase family 4 protein [Pseudomonadota bacterium]
QLDALERRALAQLDGVICTSESTRQALVGRGYDGARVRVVSPGTRRAACPPRRPRSSTPALLCVATITPRKGHPELLRALVGLRHRRWRLECLGSVHRDAEQTRRVRAIIRRQRLGSRVRLRGECDERTLERAYRRASVFVLPSHHEGYGMALAEALIHGLPVVSTTAGAIPDTVPRGAGWLVPPGDTRALRRAIAAVLCQPRRGRQMAQAARRAGRQLRSWSQARYEFDRALTELAGLR